MNTEAYFDNIGETINLELLKAKSQILIAVAWFTDPLLFNTLLQKLFSNVEIRIILINDKINKEFCDLDFTLLEKNGAKVHFVGAQEDSSNIMHNKFCIIDNMVVINGSYNWSRKARLNDENVVIFKDDREITFKFKEQFNNLLTKYGFEPIIVKNDVQNINKRLDLIKKMISLNEEILIKDQVNKIYNPENDAELKEILDLVSNNLFSKAIIKIESYISKYQSVAVYVDIQLEAIKFELKLAEIKLNTLSDKKFELEKLISDFNYLHDKYLGDIIRKLLEIKKDKLKEDYEKHKATKDQYENAKSEYDEFNDQLENFKKKKINELSENEKVELKSKYRQATLHCHPDKVSEDQQREAEEIFKELNEAYRNNDLESVSEILENLRNQLFTSKSEILTMFDKQKIYLNNINNKIMHLEKEIDKIINSEVYTHISKINDWNDYFENMKVMLTKKLNKEISVISTSHESR